jgi:guanylate kinase
MDSNHRAPQLVVISAPSGAGKTTICKKLIERNRDFRLSISATTRKPRANEVNGKDYFFISKKEFDSKVTNDEFLEHEVVHDNLYGTLRGFVINLLKDGYTILFDIDVKGALKLKKEFGNAILIFVSVPSIEDLRQRLRERKTDDKDEILKRLKRLNEEFEKSTYFDYLVINDDLNRAVTKIEEIIEKHKVNLHVSN